MEYPKMLNLGRLLFEEYDQSNDDHYELVSLLLSGQIFTFREKVNGTGMRLTFEKNRINIKGRTEESSIPSKLTQAILDRITIEKDSWLFGDKEVTIFGEGVGADIGRDGKNFTGYNLYVFDISVDGLWLKWPDVVDITEKLNLNTVPILATRSLQAAVGLADSKQKSLVMNGDPEGIVAVDAIGLLNRRGKRLIYKLHRGFVNKQLEKGRPSNIKGTLIWELCSPQLGFGNFMGCTKNEKAALI